MLESIRNHSKGPIAKVIIGLIVIPFAFTGVYSYFNAGSSQVVATVNGSEVTLREFEQAYRSTQQNWGENFDRFFNTDERLQQFRMNVLQQLINQRLSSQAIREMGLRGSDEALKQEIMANPQFQNENGQFDYERYQVLIESVGYTLKQYQDGRKSDMAAQQFFSALSDSNFSLDYELTRHQGLEAQTRDIEYLVIEKSKFSEAIDFTTEEGQTMVSQYYDLNQDRFRIPEKVAISYLLISKADFMDADISEEEINQYYEDNKSSYAGTERRKVAHILVNVPADADQETIDQARSKIDQAKSRLDTGDAFETVVSEFSDDLVSAEMGGELDWLEVGMMDEAFESAAFNLVDVGNTSEVVRSNFGFHIIKLVDLETGEAKPLEEIHSEIADTLKSDIAEERFLEARDLVAEKAFEFSDTLDEAATSVNKTVATSQLFDKQFGIGLPPELQGNPEVLEMAYSDEVLLDELNSEVIDLSDEMAVVLRKSQHQEAGITPLVEVTGQIEALITDRQANEKTAQVASDILSSMKEGASLDTISMTIADKHGLSDLSWVQQSSLQRNGTELDTRIRDEAFQLNLETNSLTQVAMANGDYAIIQLKAVNRPEPDALLAATHEQKFNEFYQQSEISGYIKLLDATADIERRLGNTEIIQ